MTDTMLESTVYLTLEPTFKRSGDDQVATKFKVAKATQSRPTDRTPVVKLKLRLPAAAFAPLAPEVTIEVPEGAVIWPEPDVTVEV